MCRGGSVFGQTAPHEGGPIKERPHDTKFRLRDCRFGNKPWIARRGGDNPRWLGNLWLSNAIRGVDAGLCELFFAHQITIKVGHRPGRNEPRANKRRLKILQLLTKPRHEAKAELESAA